jgi:hypothetical protein
MPMMSPASGVGGRDDSSVAQLYAKIGGATLPE